MKLYIQVKNGQHVNHPAIEENLVQALGRVPEDWEPFIRVERPMLGVYQVMDSQDPTYQKIDGVWKDVWAVRDMNESEKSAKQQAVKDWWAENGFASWIFNEQTCAFEPPVPHPQDDKFYRWDEPTLSWIEVQEQT